MLAGHFPRFIERWVNWAAEESKIAENRRYVVTTAYDLTTDLREMKQKNDMLEALNQREDLDGWVRNTIAGAVQIDIAWAWRGGDTADAVSEAGWEKFGQHMKRARDLLVAAWQTQPDRPEPAGHMIAVAMAGHADESPRVWFDRAVAAEMDYPPAYLKLSNSLLPRWGGSHQEMVRFGLDCLRTQRFDTRVPLQLFTQVLAVENGTGRTDRFWRNPQVYAKLKEMFEGYEKMPTPTDEQRHGPPLDWVASMHAAVALRAGRWDDARPLLDKLQGKLLPEAMATIQVGPFDIARRWP